METAYPTLEIGLSSGYTLAVPVSVVRCLVVLGGSTSLVWVVHGMRSWFGLCFARKGRRVEERDGVRVDGIAMYSEVVNDQVGHRC